LKLRLAQTAPDKNRRPSVCSVPGKRTKPSIEQQATPIAPQSSSCLSCNQIDLRINSQANSELGIVSYAAARAGFGACASPY